MENIKFIFNFVTKLYVERIREEFIFLSLVFIASFIFLVVNVWGVPNYMNN